MHNSARIRGGANGTLALVVALVALAAAIFAIAYQVQVVGPRDERISQQNEVIQKLTGVNNPRTTNMLASRYADANGDLVADTPSKTVDPTVLKFSYVAVEDHTEFKQAFAPVMDAIAKATGKKVEYVEFASTEDEVRALRDGTLHVAGLNTGAVPLAVCTAGFQPICSMADASGIAGYQMQVITSVGSPVQKLVDLKGRELTFTEMNSNSGYKAPIVILREEGLRPGQEYYPRYSQGHPQSIAGIQSGTFETVAIASDVLKRSIADGKIAEKDFRVIFTSPQTFPAAGFGVAHELNPELTEKIKQALLSFDWTGTAMEKQFGREGRSRFVTVDYKKDWDYVRRIDESYGYSYELTEATTQPAP